jgi:dTDP-4-dehydrorhamnose reductase
MRIVVTGAMGLLGNYLVDQLVLEGRDSLLPWVRGPRVDRWGLCASSVELTDPEAVASALEESNPDVIIHAAALSSADEVRRDPDAGWAANVEATRRLATWCREHGRRLIFTSTDLVFDGSGSWYHEDDPPRPLLDYGRTKAAAEAFVLQVPKGLVARLSLLFGPSRSRRESFFDRSISELRVGRPQRFFDDEFRTPLDYGTAARILVRLAESRATGIVHVAGRERVSRFGLMQRVARALGLDTRQIGSSHLADVAFAEPRPVDVSLDTSRLESVLPGLVRPSIEEAARAWP